jgi:2-desacetyl-2-hydroxyethyl bacteriochlorophyllide A dehydrogenase
MFAESIHDGRRMMRAVCFESPKRVSLRDVPAPRIESATDAIVAVEAAGLCGSDLHVYHGRETGLDAGTIMGHEFVGRIISVGDSVARFRVGDRVCAPFSTNCGHCFYCQAGLTSRCENGQLFGWVQNGIGLHGCQAEQVRVPWADGTLVRVSDDVTNGEAILLGDNLSTGFFCADLADVSPGKSCAVIGCGTVGLFAILAAKTKGAAPLVAVDQVAHRREMAQRFGASAVEPAHALEAIQNATQKRGADSVLEVVGYPDAQRLAYQMLRPGGSMGVVGCHCTPEFAFSPVQAYDKNLTYRTGRCPARHYMTELLPQISALRTSLELLITHSFSFEQCGQAYEMFASRQENCLKVLFHP